MHARSHIANTHAHSRIILCLSVDEQAQERADDYLDRERDRLCQLRFGGNGGRTRDGTMKQKGKKAKTVKPRTRNRKKAKTVKPRTNRKHDDGGDDDDENEDVDDNNDLNQGRHDGDDNESDDPDYNADDGASNEARDCPATASRVLYRALSS